MRNSISISVITLLFSYSNIAHAISNECLGLTAPATFFDATGTVCLPKVKVTDSSGTNFYEVTLKWSGPDNPANFKLIGAEINNTAEGGIATYTTEDGVLSIPIIDIPKIFGTEHYSATLVFLQDSETVSFELTTSSAYVDPAYDPNKTWKPYGILTADERRSVDLVGRSIPFAKIADAVYDFDNTQIDGWELLEQQDTDSGMQAGVYYNQDTDEIVLAFRGTEACAEGEVFTCSITEAFLDIAADALLVIGQVDEQFEDAFNYAQDVLNRSQGRKITVTGHSLGGGLAQAIGKSLGLETFAFNSAPVPENFFDDYPSELTPEELNNTIYVIADIHDPVSNTDETGKFYIGSSHVTPLIQFDFNELEIMPNRLAELDAVRFNKHGMIPFIENAIEMLTIYGDGW